MAEGLLLIGFQLHCLHGRHRIQAAREAFPPRQRWWTVDLYLADTVERDLYSEGRWWVRLSKHETRCLKDLFRHTKLKAAFDDLLGIPGLWGGMRISTLNKMISMRCDEEVLAYLTHIKDVWSQLLGQNEQAMRMVDNTTVKALELKAPKYSKGDAQMLHGQLVSGEIFVAFSLQDREAIWSVLRNIPGLIPSFFTFFRDLYYLQACAGSMRHLVQPTPRQTMRLALDDVFFGGADGWDLGYRYLWVYAMQSHRDLPAPPNQNNKKKNLLAKAGTVRPDEVVLSDFAALADRLGFQSEQISALRQRSSDREIARAA
ncbi:hypothetical protein BJ875DRAFT_502178 [Amylocarpus encephaloides]|uniref:Uncharacterized protein n=1 Tax=Amylocarpus encephaloides TaxID=45428 RepID=A0A9P8CAM5_9HELO|nr:hypothetical protein BJ875DRAFT_502178 [Amylocarpus encephaloides]